MSKKANVWFKLKDLKPYWSEDYTAFVAETIAMAKHNNTAYKLTKPSGRGDVLTVWASGWITIQKENGEFRSK